MRRPAGRARVTRADCSVARPVAVLMRMALPRVALSVNSVMRRPPSLPVIEPFVRVSLTCGAASRSRRPPLRSTRAPLLSRRTTEASAPVDTGSVRARRETRTGLAADIRTPWRRSARRPRPSSVSRLEPVPGTVVAAAVPVAPSAEAGATGPAAGTAMKSTERTPMSAALRDAGGLLGIVPCDVAVTFMEVAGLR